MVIEVLGEWSNMSHRELALPLFRQRSANRLLSASDRGTALAVAPASYRASIIALLVAISYYVGSQIGFLLTPADTPQLRPLAPNAILLAALLLTSPESGGFLSGGVPRGIFSSS